MSFPAVSPWTAAVVEAFHALLLERPVVPYEIIAARLNAAHGTSLTKNACIGFGRRQGVPKRQPPRNYAGRKPRTLKPRTRVPKVQLKPRPPKPKPKRIGKVSLLDLGPCDCRWPFGDRAPFLFCGDVTVDTSSYCLKHLHIACPATQRVA